MEYAVVKIGASQYRVSEGDTIEVDRLNTQNNEVTLRNVLLWVSNEDIKIGKPFVSDILVRAMVLEHRKGEKIRVAKYKSKVRYRKVIGFRPHLTRLRIESIEEEEKEKKKQKSAIKKAVSNET